MGDDFVTYGFPFIDVDSGGSINGMIDGVEKVIAQVPPDVKIIPGHGPVSSLDDVRAYLDHAQGDTDVGGEGTQAAADARSDEAGEAARSVEKVFDGDFINQDAFLETLYNSLTGQKNGKFIKHN